MRIINAKLRIIVYEHDNNTVDYQVWKGTDLLAQRKGHPNTDSLYETLGKDVLDNLVQVCAECREEITSRRGVVTAKDGALFHGRCWRNDHAL